MPWHEAYVQHLLRLCDLQAGAYSCVMCCLVLYEAPVSTSFQALNQGSRTDQSYTVTVSIDTCTVLAALKRVWQARSALPVTCLLDVSSATHVPAVLVMTRQPDY